LLLGGIAFELLFAAAVIYLPPLQTIFGTAPLPGWALIALLPMPVLVWGADEIYRAMRRGRLDHPESVKAVADPRRRRAVLFRSVLVPWSHCRCYRACFRLSRSRHPVVRPTQEDTP
jgi:hypothetical protein